MSTWTLGGATFGGDLQRGNPPATSGIYGNALVATSATANTMGAWAQMYSATPFDAVGFTFDFQPQANGSQHVVQVGLGAAGAEVVWFEMPVANEGFATSLHHMLYVPLNIPRGTRVSVRTQKSTATATANNVAAILLHPRSTFQPIGFNGVEYVNAPSLATSLCPTTFEGSSASSGTVGTIAEITSATTYAWKALSIRFGGNDASSLANNNPAFSLMLRVGSSNGNRVAGYYPVTAATRGVITATIGPFPCDLPAGSRLLLEILSDNTSNGTTNRIRPTIQGYY